MTEHWSFRIRLQSVRNLILHILKGFSLRLPAGKGRFENDQIVTSLLKNSNRFIISELVLSIIVSNGNQSNTHMLLYPWRLIIPVRKGQYITHYHRIHLMIQCCNPIYGKLVETSAKVLID